MIEPLGVVFRLRQQHVDVHEDHGVDLPRMGGRVGAGPVQRPAEVEGNVAGGIRLADLDEPLVANRLTDQLL